MYNWTNWAGNFVIELVIAIVFTGVGYMIHSARRRMDMRKFQRAFGRNVENADDIFFSIPLWSLQERKRTITRFRRIDPIGNAEDFYGPSNTFAREDVLGAVYVTEMMARRFKRPIRFMSDDFKIETDTWSKRSAIIVGSPIANYHARGVVRTHELFHPEDLFVRFDEIPEDDESGARSVLRDSQSGEVFASGGADDYASILRLNNRYGDESMGYVYLIGGIHAEGTQAAAIFLADCWRVFASSDGPAAVLLHLQRGQPETVKPIRYYNARATGESKVRSDRPAGAISTIRSERA